MSKTTYEWNVTAPSFLMDNTFTTGTQSQPAVASNFAGDHYFGAWTDPAGAFTVQGRVIDEDGTTVAPEFTVSPGNFGGRVDPSITGLADGHYVVTYTDTSSDPAGDIRGRLYTGNGVPVGNDFAISNGGSHDRESAVTALADGGFVVTYTRDLGGGDTDLFAQMMNADGTLRGGAIAVNGNSDNTSFSSVAGLASGGFVAVWEETATTGGDSEVRFRRFDDHGNPLDGAVGAGVLIDTSGTINKDIHVSGLPDGGFVVAYSDNGWGSGTDITVQVFNADGSARSNPLMANATTNLGTVAGNQDMPSLTVMPNGYFAVSWTDEATGKQYIQAYDADGHAIGANANLGTSVVEGEIASMHAGVIADVFRSSLTDGSGDSIRSEVAEFTRVMKADPGGELIVGVNDGIQQYFMGSAGNDIFIGGAGVDHFQGSTGMDIAGYANSTHGVYASLEVPLNGTYDAAGDTYTQIEGLEGTNFGDTLVGDFYNNVLNGIDGNDVLLGGAGDDVLLGSSGNDVLDGESGADTMKGGADNDTYVVDDVGDVVIEQTLGGIDTVQAEINYKLAANVENLVLLSGFSADNGIGNDLDNTITGNSAANLLDGGLGADTLQGGGGDDIYVVDNAGDVVIENPNEGTDAVVASVSYTLTDNVENLLLAANAGAVNATGNGLANSIAGNVNDNVINGAGGDDFLVGGGGNDTIDGGTGNDTAAYSGARADYQIERLANGDYTISDLRAGSPDGTDTLRNVEKFQFADGTIAAFVDHAPSINSSGGGSNVAVSVTENTTAVTTVAANDADPGTTLSYAISGGIDAAKFHIDATSGALSFIKAPDFEAPGDADHNNSYVVQVSASDGTLSDDQIITVNVTNVSEARNDFDDDGHSDILWQNADGTPMIWSMNGLNQTSAAVAGFNPGPAWHVIDSGDFNGDGKADILWQNADGTPAAWLMNGANVLSGANVGFNPGADWHEIAAADFNGDGKSDILWQNTNGQAAVWQMDGLNVVSGANVGQNVGADWHVIGAGDFDGDGKADILWQNQNGQAAVWLMDGTNVKSGSDVGFNPGPTWHVQGAGDFNGDGKADILWQNADGTPAVWLMDGTNVLSGANVGFNPGPAWQVHGTGDFNDDGKADIEWQNTDGTPAVWLMDGYNVLSGANAGADPGANWHVIPQHHDLV